MGIEININANPHNDVFESIFSKTTLGEYAADLFATYDYVIGPFNSRCTACRFLIVSATTTPHRSVS